MNTVRFGRRWLGDTKIAGLALSVAMQKDLYLAVLDKKQWQT